MANHSSILAWRIPHTEELGRLQSMGSQSRIQPSLLALLRVYLCLLICKTVVSAQWLSRVQLFAIPWDCSLPGSSVH